MKKGKSNKQKKLALKNKVPSLINVILKDVFSANWILSVLAVVVVVSAMFQAQTTHVARKAIAESQKLREQRQQFEIEMQSLRLEITSLTEANRISSLAKKKLDMIEVSTENEKIITL